MWDKCTIICRVLLLVFTILFAVYFIYANEKHKKQKKSGTTENFTVNIDDEYRKTIMYVFNMLLGRDPEEFEVWKYKEYMEDPYDVEPIIKIIKDTTESKKYLADLNKTKKTDTQNKDFNEITFNDQNEIIITSIINKNKNLTLDKDGVLKNFGIDDVEPEQLQKLITSKFDNETRLNIYRTVMEIYERNLDRLPTIRELNYYTYQLLTDKEFSVSKLEKILQSSREYQILIKNQRNIVNVELPGNVTDAQITFEVRRIHKEVIGGTLSREMEEFLKSKFSQEYNLDPKKLTALLQLIKSIDENVEVEVVKVNDKKNEDQDKNKNKINTSIDTNKNNLNVTSNQEDVLKLLQEESSSFTETQQERLTISKRSTAQGFNDAYKDAIEDVVNSKITFEETANPTSQDFEKILNGVDQGKINAKVCKAILKEQERKKCVSPYAYGAYSDEFYDNMSAATKAGKSSNTNKCPSNTVSAYAAYRDPYAEITVERNIDELGYACSRNAYFLNVDDDIKYSEPIVLQKKIKDINQVLPNNFDKGHVPTMGTSLIDADNTKVGSIMPKFIYKEYV